jgi:hypothetical protein
MTRMNVWFRFVAGILGLLAMPLVFSGSNSVASAQDNGNGRCSVRTVKGSYAATISGWVGTGATRVPYSDVGFVRLDGRGNLEGASTFSVDGSVGTHDIAGTYTVDSETCTGESTTTIGNFSFVIGDNGKQTRIISTTPGTTVAGEAIRQ